MPESQFTGVEDNPRVGGEGMRSYCLMGTELHFCKMKRAAVMIAQQCDCTLCLWTVT